MAHGFLFVQKVIDIRASTGTDFVYNTLSYKSAKLHYFFEFMVEIPTYYTSLQKTVSFKERGHTRATTLKFFEGQF